ncbi:IclR family transcriptional regulator [Rhodococcus ruber]|uniref:IclR family transcriptional regulator n=1 Tax=Rhodococcus ruber TaxID=1830 RepID=A0ABT4MD39_9NOCA|nr:IclR family transcriptional regulator [Rhodococcus ruber]MCZ4518902.1 IclR family transcriptional regulator [Rhodococcus ruber]
MSAENQYIIGSLDTGLQILELMLNRDTVTVTDIATELGVARSTAHRALTTLERRHFVALSSSGRGYAAGPRLVEIGSPRCLDPQSRIEARPILNRVLEETEESVHTSLLLGDQLLVVDGRRSKHRVDIGLRVGMVAPAHGMAGGKLLLSCLSDDQIFALFPDESLLRLGPKTLSTRTALMDDIAEIRQNGYAVAVQESERGVSSIALLLSGASWRDRMAIVISVPVERGSWEELMVLKDRLKGIIADS